MFTHLCKWHVKGLVTQFQAVTGCGMPDVPYTSQIRDKRYFNFFGNKK